MLAWLPPPRSPPPATTCEQYAGWIWKTDTSSDEIVGHLFGLSVAVYLSPLSAERSLASRLLTDLVKGIVANGYTLRDPTTSEPTTWGHWDPPTVNGDRRVSDGRGLASLQMLALLAGAHLCP